MQAFNQLHGGMGIPTSQQHHGAPHQNGLVHDVHAGHVVHGQHHQFAVLRTLRQPQRTLGTRMGEVQMAEHGALRLAGCP
ncbi:hypothetical protein D3C71_1852310 [compost metagenome]